MERGRKSSDGIFRCRSIVVKFCSSAKKKVPPDGNKLAGGVGTESASLKADPVSKWLNLAFVRARKQSRSLPHNPPQWKSIGSFRNKGPY